MWRLTGTLGASGDSNHTDANGNVYKTVKSDKDTGYVSMSYWENGQPDNHKMPFADAVNFQTIDGNQAIFFFQLGGKGVGFVRVDLISTVESLAMNWDQYLLREAKKRKKITKKKRKVVIKKKKKKIPNTVDER